jgi:hypothetical protein
MRDRKSHAMGASMPRATGQWSSLVAGKKFATLDNRAFEKRPWPHRFLTQL